MKPAIIGILLGVSLIANGCEAEPRDRHHFVEIICPGGAHEFVVAEDPPRLVCAPPADDHKEAVHLSGRWMLTVEGDISLAGGKLTGSGPALTYSGGTISSTAPISVKAADQQPAPKHEHRDDDRDWPSDR